MWEGAVGLILGMLVGGALVGLWLQRGSGSGQSVAELKRENARFREDVNEHFIQTAELINQLTDSYKAVFDHLSEGAEKLVEPDVVRERMPQVTDEEVRLKRLGAPRTQSDEDGDGREPESGETETSERSQSKSEDRDGEAPKSKEGDPPDQPR